MSSYYFNCQRHLENTTKSKEDYTLEPILWTSLYLVL